jgi:hypothetical protein
VVVGILDSKTRLLDTIVTVEGRRQLASGKMRVEFVSFTDGETFYQGDVASGSTDPSERVYLEACDLPHDQITFEADDAGKLTPYRGSTLGVIDGKVLSGSSDAFLHVVTGSTFASLSELLLSSSVDNFRKLYAVRTDDAFFDDEHEFSTSINDVTFNVTDSVPFRRKEVTAVQVDHIESLFQDKRLSHVPNFRYLPPVNAPTRPGQGTTPLGDFPMLGQRSTPLTYAQLIGDLASREFRVIDFAPTSIQNNLVSQVFEIGQDRMLKLDVIDYGELTTGDPEFPRKRVFFVGKVFIDSFGAQTFVNMFTLVFE